MVNKAPKILLLIIILFLSLFSNHIYAQITKITGHITDATTKEPLPFVNIAFQYSSTGTVTDFEGNYAIETKTKSDSILVSFVGYIPQTLKFERNKYQRIDIELVPSEISLKEVIIRYNGNPADAILDSIIQNKDKNNITNFDYTQYECYNKIQFDLNNITEDFKNRRAFKKFSFIFDYIDTSTVNNKTYLPIFLSESISNIYTRNNPKSKKEYIQGIKVSGIDNESIGQFMGDLYQNINVYENYISLFEKSFVSPLSGIGGVYYKYYLVDSTFKDDVWCYNIVFKPKRSGDLTFNGNFWVADSSWAIKEIKLNMAKEANINYIDGMVIEHFFTKTKQNYWVLSKELTTIDFNIFEDSKKTVGFYGKKTSSYQNHILNIDLKPEIFKSPTDIIVSDEAYKRTEAFWSIARHEELNQDERTIYYMIDTLTSLPIYKTYIDIIQTLIQGYKIYKNVEFGPYMSFISFNQVEGTRLRFGGRTSNAFSTTFMLNAHIAYGLRDETLKYGTGIIYMFNKNPRRAFGASIKHDMEQIGQSQNAFREDFLLAALFQRSPANKLSMVDEYKTYYEHEWFNGFQTTIGYTHRNVFPVEDARFIVTLNDITYEKKYITTSEINFNIRFAYKEKFLMGEFERTSAGTKYPVIELQYSYGIPSIFGSDYEFHKALFSVKQWFDMGPIGWSRYRFEAGKIFGKLPYPLLKLHEGNETYFMDEYSFNTMNYYEFVSDQYASLTWTHHFDGLFLNRIPLMKKLKWREVAYFKGLVGSLETKNENYSEFPVGLTELSKPYFETGCGIENIFKVIRIDAIWRLSYLDRPNIAKFGIYGSFVFSF